MRRWNICLKKFQMFFFRSCNNWVPPYIRKSQEDEILNISGYIQRKTLIRSSLERLEDALKHAVIRSDARLKCLTEKIFEMCFPVM